LPRAAGGQISTAPQPPQTPAPPPRQEPGARPARALPYAFEASARLGPEGLELTIANTGAAGAGFALYPAQVDAGGPWFYAVEAGKALSDLLPVGQAYDFTLHGPNGFLRQFRGGAGEALEVTCRGADDSLAVRLRNTGAAAVTVRTSNAYVAGAGRTRTLAPGAEAVDVWPVDEAAHWYDVTVSVAEDARFLRRLAGHLETGRPSRSDPALDWA